MSNQQIRRLAKTITSQIFANRSGTADRLVLTVDGPPPRDLGGWEKKPFIDRVAAILRKELNHD